MDNLDLLSKYYGIPSERGKGFRPLESITEHTIKILRPLVPNDSASEAAATGILCLLDCLLINHPEMNKDFVQRLAYEEWTRRDLLKLYSFMCRTHSGDVITMRSTTETIRLANYGNWFFDKFLQPFLKDCLSNRNTEETERKGRLPSDPRFPILLLGTWELLSDHYTFRTPMPNTLCNCLLSLLQLWDVLPQNPVIDVMWIRSQLRYIRAKKTRPIFPVSLQG